MEDANCSICNNTVKIDGRITKKEKGECLCYECISNMCEYRGKTYNVSTHTACHCNTLRPPIKKLLPSGKEVCICYSHWKHYFNKRCVRCKVRNNRVKVCIDGLPYCNECKIDEREYCKTVSSIIINKCNLNNDVTDEIMNKIMEVN